MTVGEFLSFAAANMCFVLRDSRNGREYTAVTKYLDREVTGCYARCKVDKHSDYTARAELVVWIKRED